MRHFVAASVSWEPFLPHSTRIFMRLTWYRKTNKTLSTLFYYIASLFMLWFMYIYNLQHTHTRTLAHTIQSCTINLIMMFPIVPIPIYGLQFRRVRCLYDQNRCSRVFILEDDTPSSCANKTKHNNVTGRMNKWTNKQINRMITFVCFILFMTNW